MLANLQAFWNDETGPELVEWAVVTIILLVAAVVLYVAVGRALGGVICAVFCWIGMVANGSKIDELSDRSVCDNKEDNCNEDV